MGRLDRLMGNKLLTDQRFSLQSSLEKGVMRAYSSFGPRKPRSREEVGHGLEQFILRVSQMERDEGIPRGS